MNGRMYSKEEIKLMINSIYGSSVMDGVMEIFRRGSRIDPIKPKKSIKAHSFIKKDFSGGLTRLLQSSINYDYASLYPTR